MADESKQNGPVDQTDEKMALKMYEQEPEVAENDLDSSKVKFINGGADVQVHVEDKPAKQGENGFCGLTKEELMEYSKDPFWVKVRWILLVLFWVAWFGMLAAAILIIVFAPKCPPRPNLNWWQKSLTYQIYPRSFQDTNGDGIGDLKGVEQHVDYLQKLNVTAVYFNPMYPSGGADFGYDIIDFRAIDPVFGTMEDFENLRIAMHKRGIRVIMDFIPNHTGKNHTWFQQSQAGADNDYSNYYVWHPGTTVNGAKQPPNNWLSVFGDSAWTFDDQRQEYYLHQFLSEQPDLNMSNPAVQDEMSGVLTFWLEKGVDGFRIDALAHLFEGDLDVDELHSGANVPANDYKSLIHNQTTFQPQTYEMVTKWKALLQAYSDTEGRKHPRLLIGEVYDAAEEQIDQLYSYNGQPGLDMPLNMNLVGLVAGCDAECVHGKVRDWTTVVPAAQTEKERWSNWQVGNHDNSRVASRLGQNRVNAANMLLMTLPGTAFVYYGDEIGMHDVEISWEDTQDPAGLKWGQAGYKNYSRDPERTPMQWTGGVNAGFTAGQPWLPVAGDYKQRNVQAQIAHGSGVTEYEVLQTLASVRGNPSMQWGVLEEVVVNRDILSYVRQAEGFPGFLVAINFGTEPTTTDFNAASPKFVPKVGSVAASTENFGSSGRAEDFEVGTEVTLTAVYLKPGEGVVVEFPFMG